MSSVHRQIHEGLVAWLGGITLAAGFRVSVGSVSSVQSATRNARLPGLQAVPGQFGAENLGMRRRRLATAMFGVFVVCDSPSSLAQAMDLCGDVVNRVEVTDSSGRFLGLSIANITIWDVQAVNVQPVEVADETSRGERRWLVEVQVDYTYLRGQA